MSFYNYNLFYSMSLRISKVCILYAIYPSRRAVVCICTHLSLENYFMKKIKASLRLMLHLRQNVTCKR